ncbi:hypothetical protein CEXT_113181 [Caerostris extrusa]|uniref:Uncharacterized protein n=1 Tax=Caerostris extrusa TaxID=172846 RepID=A0AAV4XRX5_CAEEX|nr:hypothetical protein CEXT_113181 [Caerostris extrusa]
MERTCHALLIETSNQKEQGLENMVNIQHIRCSLERSLKGVPRRWGGLLHDRPFKFSATTSLWVREEFFNQRNWQSQLRGKSEKRW